MFTAIHPSKLLTALLYGTAFATSGIGPNAMAQAQHSSDWNLAVGVGAMVVSAPWKGANNQVALVPNFDISKGNWHFNGDDLIGYQVQLNESWGASVGLGVRADGYDGDGVWLNKLKRHPVFDGYKEPDTEAVVNYGISYRWLALHASTDVSNNSDATSASLSAAYPLVQMTDGLTVTATASIDWYDAEYVNYYYGVAGNQVNTSVGRTAYRAGAATNYGLGVSAAYPISDRWTVMGMLSRTKLDDPIINSPLVDSKYQDVAVVLLTFRLQ